jgi:tRNA 5-methylaminomethyl-2-thiouridine biosynthesis bifunctional protein
MAGACMVRALAVQAASGSGQTESGPQITAFEASDQPATGASGNPIGIVHPFISKDWNLASQFMQRGVETTLRWVQELGGEASGSSSTAWAGITGVMQLAEDDEEAQAWQVLSTARSDLQWLTQQQIQSQLGLTDAPIGGLWSAQGGWIKPTELVKACLDHARSLLGQNLTIHLNHLIQPEDLVDLHKDFDAVVICTAHDDLLPWAGLKINRIAGQVSWVRDASLNQMNWPKAVICRSGYLSPVIDNQVLVGATFDRDPSNTAPASLQPTAQAHAENLQRVAEISPALAKSLTPIWQTKTQGRVAIRHASHDRMPHIGQVISQQALKVDLPRSASQLHHLPREDQLYVLGGLGSRGLSIAPLAAELLATQIVSASEGSASKGDCAEQERKHGAVHAPNAPSAPLPRNLLDAVDPARFVLRAHRRGG